jgi:hypothetical protein
MAVLKLNSWAHLGEQGARAGRSLYVALGIHSRFRDTKEPCGGQHPWPAALPPFSDAPNVLLWTVPSDKA